MMTLDTVAIEALRQAKANERIPLGILDVAEDFSNLFTQKMDTWNPARDGYYFLHVIPGKGTYEQAGQSFSISLHHGSIGSHSQFLADAQKAYSKTIAEFPDWAGRLEIVLAPCAFAAKESFKGPFALA